jgi:hypothetical protein
MPLNTLVEDIAQLIFWFTVSGQIQSDYLNLANRALVEAAHARLSKMVSRPGEHWQPEAGKEQAYIARCKAVCSATPENVDELSF